MGDFYINGTQDHEVLAIVGRLEDKLNALLIAIADINRRVHKLEHTPPKPLL